MFSKKIIELIATFFYVGKLPFMPGSMASILGVFIYCALYDNISLYLALFFILTVLGFYASARMEDILQQKDPQVIVIDEVVGVMLAFFFLPLTPATVVTAFFVFRAFDMFKIYPVNKLEHAPGGIGVMMDDVIAGIYTNITMHLAIRFAQLL